MVMVDRKTGKEKKIEYSGSIKFLYTSFFGRILLKLISLRFISKVVGIYMNSKLSKILIKKMIKKYNIDISKFEDKIYKSYNDFFTRHKKDFHYNVNKNFFISPADSKLLVIKLNNQSSFDIKGSIYNLKNIIDIDLSEEYNNGYALIFRLEVSDYHRYHYIDNGVRSDYKHIKGCLHTVQPIALSKYKVFHRNSREYAVLHTDNFGDIVQIEVGALMVGKIVNNEKKQFKKGDEKGYFEFGGSTIILFVKKDKVIIDSDILLNSTLGKETIVSCGEKIGIKYK